MTIEMKPATDEQIEQAVADRSATDAKALLASQGLIASTSRCDVIISRMIVDGRRQRLPSVNGRVYTDAVDIDPFHARVGCQRLLAAQLRTGAHWIHDPARMAAAMREAGLRT